MSVVLPFISLFCLPLGPGAFNAELEEFSTIDRALGTLLFAVLGESVDFREISGTNRFLAPMFHFLFTLRLDCYTKRFSFLGEDTKIRMFTKRTIQKRFEDFDHFQFCI